MASRAEEQQGSQHLPLTTKTIENLQLKLQKKKA